MAKITTTPSKMVMVCNQSVEREKQVNVTVRFFPTAQLLSPELVGELLSGHHE